MPTLKYIIFILLIIMVSLFAAKNMHTVEVHFLDGHFSETVKIPVVVLISSSFAIGFLFVWIFELFTRIKLKTQLRIKDRKIQTLESELLDIKKSDEFTSQHTESITENNR